MAQSLGPPGLSPLVSTTFVVPKSAGVVAGSRTADASNTEANDTLSATASLALKATLSATEANDTLSSTAALALQATLSATEANDTLSAMGALALQATLSAMEAADTLSATGSLALQANATITEANDTLSATAVLAIVGNASITEGTDTLTATGALAITANSSITEAPDAITAAGGLLIVGTLTALEAGDIISTTGLMGIRMIYGASGSRWHDVEVLHWGFLQALPQKIFDFILETAPREQPRPPEPVIAPVVPKPQSAPVASFVAVPEPIPQDVTVGWEPFHGYARSRVVQVYLDMQPLYRERRAITAKYAKAANEHDKQLIKDYLAKKGKNTWA